ncbi:DUF418 domain-containing protein [Achromobacter piechaudii]|uniref:DUF418 domain-containing protein n=1 Tax=Achromobacter piechaudii TaxID=72556 RepID=UPI003DA7A83D
MTVAPTLAEPRLHHVDALRGFALFGILIVNIGVFSSPFYGAGMADPNYSSALDVVVRWLIACLFETKFYLLFSFLFGYSFTLQMSAAERGQAAFGPRFLRRLAGLAALGLMHAVLFYQGDILLTYALLGLGLLACRTLAPKHALRAALWLIVVASLVWALLGLLSYLDPVPADYMAQYHAEALASIQAYRGTIGTTIDQHIHELSTSVWFMVLFVQGPFVFAMFLAGYALGRRRALDDPWRQPRVLWLLCAIGLLPGLAGSALYATSSLPSAGVAWELPGLAADLLTAPLLSMTYAAAFLLAIRTRALSRLGAWLAPAGRMALSNYLMQSVICALLFTGWGLRLFASVSPLTSVGIAVAIFGLQLPWSAWWLRRHAYGPVEWVLRAFTLWALPPWRRTRAA